MGAEAARLHARGAKWVEIAERFGVTVAKVHGWAVREGDIVNQRTEQRAAEIARLRAEGLTWRAVGEALGIGKGSAWQWARRHQMAPGPRSRVGALDRVDLAPGDDQDAPSANMD